MNRRRLFGMLFAAIVSPIAVSGVAHARPVERAGVVHRFIPGLHDGGEITVPLVFETRDLSPFEGGEYVVGRPISMPIDAQVTAPITLRIDSRHVVVYE